MSGPRFDLGLTDEDLAAMREARPCRFEFDGPAALRFIALMAPLVDAEVRRRPLFSGAPFELPTKAERGQRSSAHRAGKGAFPALRPHE